jgi:hypothetical protein
MPLTRHLYREDEVVAALMFCILRKRSTEAAFWCSELLDSGLVDEMIGGLQRIWLCAFGIKALGWLRAFQEVTGGDEVSSEEIIGLVVGLSIIGGNGGRDRSIITLLADPIAEQPDRVNTGDVSPAFTPLEAFVARAILQRRSRTAWGGLHGMETPDVFLQKIAMAKHGIAGCRCLTTIAGTGLSPWEQRATIVAALCLDHAAFIKSWSQNAVGEVPSDLETWTANLGRRARRVYAIPDECLYWFTRRGKELSVYDTNEKEIMGRLEKSAALWGSDFWDSVAEEFGGWLKIKTDAESREAFYEAHFPDDIPDEWSSAERAKSHSRGVLQKTLGADASRALQTLFGRLPTAVVWGPLPPVKNVETWEDLWADVGSIDTKGWNLTPVVERKLLC